MTSRVQKVAFTMYPIKDPDRARAFYGETLGLTVGTNHDQWIEYDLPGGGCLALTTVTGEEPSASAGGTVALEVDDLDAAIEELKAQDVTFKSDIIHSPVCRMAVILDSEGNSILLHQLKPK